MPDTTPDQTESGQRRRDAHDKVTLVILVFTLIATGCAACFTAWQAWIAQDQEHRTLRAYVVVEAELLADQGGENPYVKLTAENMGQTPVYNLILNTSSSVIGKFDGISEIGKILLTFDCLGKCALALMKRRSYTFSKSESREMAIGTTINSVENVSEAFLYSQRVITYGTICYSDIFQQTRAIHMCYEWHLPNDAPQRCEDEEAGEQSD